MLYPRDKQRARAADAGDLDFVLSGQLDPDDLCSAERLSYRNPDHLHSCTAPRGHAHEDGHVCPCGDWWHD